MQDPEKIPVVSKRERRILSFYFLAVVVVAVFYFGIDAFIHREFPPSTMSRSVEIAVLAPVSGTMSELGNSLVSSVEIAIENIPAQYLAKDMNVTVRVYDTKNTAAGAASAALKAARRPQTVAVIGPLDARQIAAAAEVLEGSNLVLITPSSTLPSLTPSQFSGVYRIPAVDNLQGKAIVNFLNDANLKDVFFIGEAAASVPEIVNAFNAAAKNKLKMVGSVIIEENQDYPAIVQEIVDKNAQVVVYLGGVEHGRVLLSAMAEAELEIPFFGCELINQKEILPLPENSPPVYYTSSFFSMVNLKNFNKPVFSDVLKNQQEAPFRFESLQAVWMVQQALKETSGGAPRVAVWNNLGRVSIEDISNRTVKFSNWQKSPQYIYLYYINPDGNDWLTNKILDIYTE